MFDCYKVLRNHFGNFRHKEKIVLVLVFVFLISSCASKSYLKLELNENPSEYFSADVPDEFRAYPIVYLRRDAVYTDYWNLNVEYHEVFKIQNKAGLEYANISVVIPFGAELLGINGRVIFPSGRETKLDQEDIFTEYRYLQGKKEEVKRIYMPGVEVGGLIEYKYKIAYPFFIPFPWYFTVNFPVLESTLTVRANPFFRMNYLIHEKKDVPIDVKELDENSGSANKFLFTAKDIAPVRYELSSPAYQDVASYVSFSITHFLTKEFRIEGSSWKDAADNYWEVVESFLEEKETPEIDAFVKRYEKLSRNEKIERIYEFVKDSVRYATVFRKSGVIPLSPEMVFKKRYGDCKDQSILLISLLRKSDITAYAVLCKVRSEGELVTKFYSLQQFDHVCVVVPDDENSDVINENNAIFLDPILSYSKTGECSSEWEDTYGLLVKKNTGGLIKLPSIEPQSNGTLLKCELEPQGDKLLADIKISYFGDKARMAKAFLDNIDEKSLANLVLSSFKDCILEDFEISDDNGDMVIVELKLSFSGFFIKSGNRERIIFPTIKRFPFYSFLDKTQREHSVDLTPRYSFIDSTIIHIPRGYKISNIPKDFETFSLTFRYSADYSKERDKILLLEKFSIDRSKVLMSDINRFMSQIRDVYDYRENMFVKIEK
jgi:hypothetical protein